MSTLLRGNIFFFKSLHPLLLLLLLPPLILTTNDFRSDDAYSFEINFKVILQNNFDFFSHSCAMSTSSIKGSNSYSLLGISQSIWILDSRASHHISYEDTPFLFLNSTLFMSVMTVDGSFMPLVDIGYVSTINM